MNGKIKFHKANGPAFAPGEVWGSGHGACTIDSVRKLGPDKWDYQVTYHFDDGRPCTKDAWNFQVRHQHPADRALRV